MDGQVNGKVGDQFYIVEMRYDAREFFHILASTEDEARKLALDSLQFDVPLLEGCEVIKCSTLPSSPLNAHQTN